MTVRVGTGMRTLDRVVAVGTGPGAAMKLGAGVVAGAAPNLRLPVGTGDTVVITGALGIALATGTFALAPGEPTKLAFAVAEPMTRVDVVVPM